MCFSVSQYVRCFWVSPVLNKDSNFHKQGINVHLAKKMIEDRSRDYMNARRVAKVRRRTNYVQAGLKYIYIFFCFITQACFVNTGVWDCDERVRQERTFGSATELSSGGSAGGNVEKVHPVGKKQSAAHRRSDSHHKER